MPGVKIDLISEPMFRGSRAGLPQQMLLCAEIPAGQKRTELKKIFHLGQQNVFACKMLHETSRAFYGRLHVLSLSGRKVSSSTQLDQIPMISKVAFSLGDNVELWSDVELFALVNGTSRCCLPDNNISQ